MLAKRLLARGVGTRPLVLIGAVGYAGLWLAGLVRPGPFALLLLMLAWFMYGASNAFVDVPLGIAADLLNQGDSRGNFAALGMFSFTVSSIIGSGVSALLVAHGVPLAPHMAVIWGIGILITLVTLAGPNLHWQPDVDGVAKKGGGARVVTFVTVVAVVGLAPLGAVFTYAPQTVQALGASRGVAAAATVVFTVAGGLVQLAGWLARRSRPQATVICAAVASFAGAAALTVAAFGTSISTPVRVAVALATFAVVGGGLQLPATVLPEYVGKLARRHGMSPTRVQADLTQRSYIALGIGQALSGFIAALLALGPASIKVVALPLAMALLVAMCGVVMAAGVKFVEKR